MRTCNLKDGHDLPFLCSFYAVYAKKKHKNRNAGGNFIPPLYHSATGISLPVAEWYDELSGFVRLCPAEQLVTALVIQPFKLLACLLACIHHRDELTACQQRLMARFTSLHATQCLSLLEKYSELGQKFLGVF
jgi:hypothetical protein